MPQHPLEGATIVERGHIYFFYRPRIDVTAPKSFEDVARLYILLARIDSRDLVQQKGKRKADTEASERFYRWIRIGKKKMPSTTEHNRFWGLIEEATPKLEVVHELIGSVEYSTITQGERITNPCRIAGAGE